MSRSITGSELRRKLPGKVQLVDVRSASEFASGHIPGAVNLPMDQIEARLQDLSPQAPIVLVCQAGKRARITADLLSAGHQIETFVLDGGTNAWIKAQLPLVCCAKTRWSLERQVRLIAGSLVLAGAALALKLTNRFILLSGFVGLGLVFAGLTDICPMALALAKLPWNQPRRCRSTIPGLESVQ